MMGKDATITDHIRDSVVKKTIKIKETKIAN